MAVAALAAVAATARAQPRAATPRSTFVRDLIRAAVAQTAGRVTYDGSYRRIGYRGLVTWMLPGNVPHIGLVTNQRSPDGQRPLVAHNIGRGPQIEDMLFAFPVTGHYRYGGE